MFKCARIVVLLALFACGSSENLAQDPARPDASGDPSADGGDAAAPDDGPSYAAVVLPEEDDMNDSGYGTPTDSYLASLRPSSAGGVALLFYEPYTDPLDIHAHVRFVGRDGATHASDSIRAPGARFDVHPSGQSSLCSFVPDTNGEIRWTLTVTRLDVDGHVKSSKTIVDVPDGSNPQCDLVADAEDAIVFSTYTPPAGGAVGRVDRVSASDALTHVNDVFVQRLRDAPSPRWATTPDGRIWSANGQELDRKTGLFTGQEMPGMFLAFGHGEGGRVYRMAHEDTTVATELGGGSPKKLLAVGSDDTLGGPFARATGGRALTTFLTSREGWTMPQVGDAALRFQHARAIDAQAEVLDLPGSFALAGSLATDKRDLWVAAWVYAASSLGSMKFDAPRQGFQRLFVARFRDWSSVELAKQEMGH